MPVTITIPADATANLHGLATTTVRVPVLNAGSVPLRVAGSVESVTAKAKAHPAVSWVTSISPRSVLIAPHHEGFIVLHVRVPAGNVSGVHYLNFVAHAATTASKGQVKIAGGVGGTLKLTHAGHKMPVPPVIRPVPHGGSPLVLLLVGFLIAAALVAAGLWGGRRLLRRSQRRRSAHAAARRLHPTARRLHSVEGRQPARHAAR